MGKLKVYLFLLICLAMGRTSAQVVLSEIMFNPQGTERYNEFVEIYNTGTETVDLAGWLIGDSTKSSHIVAVNDSTLLAPQQYGIILSPNYFENSDSYDAFIPDETLVLQIESSQFGAYGFANDRSERVTLQSADSTIVSAWAYRSPNPDGISEEKKVLENGDEAFNWDNGTIVGGTPGFRNSIAPVDFDLALDSLSIHTHPQNPTRSDSIYVNFNIFNNGIEKLENTNLTVYLDKSFNGLTNDDSVILNKSINTASLGWLDSTKIKIALQALPAGLWQLFFEINNPQDEIVNNNIMHAIVDVSFQLGDVALTELALNPQHDQPAWIEILNTSESPINIKDWSLYADDTRIFNLPDDYDIWVEENQRLVITHSVSMDLTCWGTTVAMVETKFKTLPDVVRKITLQNESGESIDSLALSDNIAATNISYEQAEPINGPAFSGNWGLCPHPNQSTLGEINAFGRDFVDVSVCTGKEISQQEKAIAGEPTQIKIKVTNFGTLDSSPLNLSLFLAANDSFITRHTIEAPIPANGEIDADFELLFQRPDVYNLKCIVQSENDEYFGNNVFEFSFPVGFPQNTLLINEIMYNTDERGQEWVELYNPNNEPVNIKNWVVKDSKKVVTITDENNWIEPNSYLVLSNVEMDIEQNLVTTLPELNNSKDNVVIADFAGNPIDSLSYENAWGGDRFVSLERVRFEENSTDIGNWASCLDSVGHTAGQYNSVSPKTYNLAIVDSSLTFLPDKPSQGETVEFSVMVKNVGLEPLTTSTIKLFSSPLASSDEWELLQSEQIQSMHQDEQKQVHFQWKNIPGGVFWIKVIAENQLDNNLSKNETEKMLISGYTQNSLVVNEIMYNPVTDRRDWIEIYNPTNQSLELAHWFVSNADTSRAVLITDSSRVVQPNEYFVISSDTLLPQENPNINFIYVKSAPNFRMDGDDVILLDGIKNINERVSYDPSWGDLKGRSLERINPNVDANEPSNWGQNVSAAGHSAGLPNSVYTSVIPSHASLEISPDPFSPDGDGIDDLAGINISLPTTHASINIKIFDIQGRLVKYLVNNEFSGSQKTIFWDGKNDEGLICRIGIYIIYLEAVDDKNEVILQEKKTVVLATKL